MRIIWPETQIDENLYFTQTLKLPTSKKPIMGWQTVLSAISWRACTLQQERWDESWNGALFSNITPSHIILCLWVCSHWWMSLTLWPDKAGLADTCRYRRRRGMFTPRQKDKDNIKKTAREPDSSQVSYCNMQEEGTFQLVELSGFWHEIEYVLLRIYLIFRFGMCSKTKKRNGYN